MRNWVKAVSSALHGLPWALRAVNACTLQSQECNSVQTGGLIPHAGRMITDGRVGPAEDLEVLPGGLLMASALWNNVVLAESDKTVIVEGNHYFPPESVRREYLKPSSTHTICPWKGTASYYDIEVNGRVNKDAAWFYPSPHEAAKQIADHVAFWKGVEVKV
jgi:uncharacterized protein (DUF427 family)